MTQSVSDNQAAWLTLGEVSTLLGVHPATVRQWSDEGKLDAFRTPGGHRRFARADIERLLHMHPVRGHGLTTYLVNEAVERTRRSLPEALAQAPWAQHLQEDQRAHWRTAGRGLLALVAGLATRAELSSDQCAAALAFGRNYGRMMASAGHSLPDAVLAFLFFRDFLLETVLQLPETTGLDREQTVAIVKRVNALLNNVLCEMMRVFEAPAPAGSSSVSAAVAEPNKPQV
ncbi:MAG TPA: helix-turn-helix domain-containing protein [Herpetosiphonaceae bacterium]|nr:helix-turn-helix domain-containing protein [Herpetosiphonaceae bacterium]